MPVVVLFKSESDGPDKFVQLLEESDYEVRSINCLNFKFKNLEPISEEMQKVDGYEGMIFTSQRAIQAVFKATESDPEQLVQWQQKTNYSVGESTSESAKSLLHLDTKGNETGNAQALASLIVDNHRNKQPKPFLFPSGNLKQDILEKSLKENSIEVQCVEAYETVQHSDLEKLIEELKAVKIEFIVFFSPSGIKFSMPLLKKHEVNLESVKAIAIGPSTKKTLEENNVQCFRMCSKPTPQSLLEALAS
jgi:uroporphyrinogen-III synthase